MSGLRETKKAATRTALTRAAAEIALDHGPEGLTIAEIAARAGVSARTFHNYFTSREEALLGFLSDRIRDLIDQLDEVPRELNLVEAVEHLVVEHLRTGEDELDSFGTLFRVSEIVGALSPTPQHPGAGTVVVPLLPAVHPRAPDLDDFEACVAINTLATAVRVALEWFYRQPEPRDIEVGAQLVRRACRMVLIDA